MEATVKPATGSAVGNWVRKLSAFGQQTCLKTLLGGESSDSGSPTKTRGQQWASISLSGLQQSWVRAQGWTFVLIYGTPKQHRGKGRHY